MTTIAAFYLRNATEFPDKAAFFGGPPDFKESLTWKEIWVIASELARELKEKGVQAQDAVGILSSSTWRWEVAELAIFLCKAVVVGIDPHDRVENYVSIVKKTNLKFLFCENSKLENRLPPGHDLKVFSMNFQKPNVSEHPIVFNPDSFPQPQAQAVLIFTSGTTSEPKGISYSHDQLLKAIQEIVRAFPSVPKNAKVLSWLPLSNLFQRVFNFSAVVENARIYFVENPLDVVNHLKTISPHVMIGVPRFYEKVYEQILLRLNSTFTSRAVTSCALFFARKRSHLIQKKKDPGNFLNSVYRLFQNLIFKKIKGVFGQDILFLVSGSSALRREVIEFFHACDLLVLEAYGVSENCIPVSINKLEDFRFGSVGKPLIKDSVTIAQDGEVLIKGDGVFEGYLQSSSPHLTSQGFLPTGDLGYFDSDGFLFLQGRKGEVFKTSTGKKVPALEIEECFKSLDYIDMAVAIGENRKAVVVVLSLEFSILAKSLAIKLEELWDTQNNQFSPLVIEKVQSHVLHKNSLLADKIRPAGILVLTRKFLIENKEMTSNLKIRRKFIENRFSKDIDAFYVSLESKKNTEVLFLDWTDKKITEKTESEIPFRGIHRIALILKLLLDVGSTYVLARLQSHPDEKVIRKLGQILRRGLGNLRGPLQKLGQMMSYLEKDLPQSMREEVSQLLKNSQPVNSFIIRALVEKHLKKPIPAVFENWQDVAVATGSIGQVHRANLKSGQPVAVKVQLPMMDRMVKADSQILKICTPLIHLLLKNRGAYEHVEELITLMNQEYDFKLEARRIKKFATLFKGESQLKFPVVHEELSGPTVLTMDCIEGVSFSDFCKTANVADRERVARIIFSYTANSIFKYGIFNADPHSGNFIISDSTVGVIDFGSVKEWNLKFIEQMKKQSLCVIENNLEEFKKWTVEIGFQFNPKMLKALFDLYRDVFLLPFVENKKFKFTHDYVRSFLVAIRNQLLVVEGSYVPSQYLALTRLYWEHYAMLADLDVELNYHEMLVPILRSPTVGVGEWEESSS